MTRKRQLSIGVGAIIASSIIAWVVTYAHHLVTTYSDAMSRLDIARMVVDNLQPGLAQLGSVWLPLNQLFSLPLIWNTWAWHSGFAGSFISMASYVVATVYVFKIIRELTSNQLAAGLGALAFGLNPNLLYLQSTPLTEPLFLALMITGTCYLIRYLKTRDPKFLALAAVLLALQVLTRYDGWFIAGIDTLVLLGAELIVYKQAIKKVIGTLTLFLTPALIAMLLWFLWNYLIFGNILYSFTGPYSAHAQQAVIQARSGLITKNNLLISSKAFGLDALLNIGVFVTLAGIAGWALYLIRTNTLPIKMRLLIANLLLAAIAFNIIALFIGFSILNIPELHWAPSHTLAGEYFNVRYGITALPFVAVGFGLLAAKLRPSFRLLLIPLVFLQFGLLVGGGLITVKDGTIGSSAFLNQDIAAAIKADVAKNDRVVMSSSVFNGVMFESGLNLKQYIHEGVSREWQAAIADPTLYAKWVVTANGNFGDPVYNSLVTKERSVFLRSYKLVYAGQHANLYMRLAPYDQFIGIAHNQLEFNDTTFQIRGVNSYDLAYQSNAQIADTFKALQQAHVNTVRFWLFGDGIANGFQPSAGILNEKSLEKTDYILAQAYNYRIRVMPTLVNNFNDYGGANQYVSWVGLDNAHDQFFTNPTIIALYENYLNHILSRNNHLRGIEYSNDPTIAAWDIMNEPRTDNGNTAPIATWANQIARYIKQKDSNHLVTISLDKPTADSGESTICASQYLDFCSMHIYPQDPGIASYTSYPQELQAITKYKQIASSIKKPAVVSEIGISKAYQPFNQPPLPVLSDSLQAINKDGYSGWLIWNWSQNPDSSFGFSPDGTNGLYTQNDLEGLTALR
ncbi:MAG TPA: cellulase family glycosylhydrolase [Candidatus Saccharimonadales bacterium]|nr:cellulase family glycosylhydrolase [Candidatus Saccharimonadales bacterium]